VNKLVKIKIINAKINCENSFIQYIPVFNTGVIYSTVTGIMFIQNVNNQSLELPI